MSNAVFRECNFSKKQKVKCCKNFFERKLFEAFFRKNRKRIFGGIAERMKKKREQPYDCKEEHYQINEKKRTEKSKVFLNGKKKNQKYKNKKWEIGQFLL